MNVRELREKRAKLLADCRAIIADQERAGREKFTTDEQTRYDAAFKEAKELGETIGRLAGLETEERDISETLNPHRAGKEGPSGTENGPPVPGRFTGSPRRSFDRSEAFTFLRRDERFSDYVRSASVGGAAAAIASKGKERLAGVVRGMVTGDWSGAAEERTMGGGVDVGGGYLLSDATSSFLIDLARNQARLIQAGAITVPLNDRNTNLAKVTGDLTAYWKAENAAGTFSDVTLGRITMTPHTLIALTSMSVELAEDASNVGDVVETALSSSLALELDRVGIRGLGAGEEPQGIRNWPGVQSITGVATPSYDDFSLAVQKVAEANGEASAALLAPRDAGTLDRLKDSTGQVLVAPASYLALKKFTTNQIPTNLGGGTNESEAYVGDFSNVLIGMRSRVLIEASREAADASGSAFKNLQIWLRAYLRADIAIAREEHLVMLTGITT